MAVTSTTYPRPPRDCSLSFYLTVVQSAAIILRRNPCVIPESDSGSPRQFRRVKRCPWVIPPRLSILRPAVPRRGSCRACLLDSPLDESPGSNPDDESIDSSKGATINLNLPRRSLLVQFTCNECGERTSRLVNKLAYERGLIYVQCAGCHRYHKLVDNLGLVMEYDLRENYNEETNTDQ